MSDISKARLLSLAFLVAIFAIAPAALWAFGKSYYWQIANLALIFALLAGSMHLVTGVAGLLQLGHAAFYGVGAYAAAILATKYGLSFVFTLPLAGLVAAVIALLVALPTMRLVSIYFAVATLAIGQMLYLVMLNWIGLTKGPNGIMLFSGMKAFGFDLSGALPSYFVVALTVCASLFLLHRLSHSYYGNALRALREDDQCADAMGIDTVRLKIEGFAISGFFAGIAGAVGAHGRLHLAARFQLPDLDPDPRDGGGRRARLAAGRGGRRRPPDPAAGGAAADRRRPQHHGRRRPVRGDPVRAQGPHRRSLRIVVCAKTARRRVAARRRRRRGRLAMSGRLQSSLLNVEGATRRFGGLIAVDNVDMTVAPGELVGVIGPNGAGKTTLFNLISGFTPLSSGAIHFDGARIDDQKSFRIARAGIGRTFQNLRVFPNMSVFDNVSIGAIGVLGGIGVPARAAARDAAGGGDRAAHLGGAGARRPGGDVA